MRTKRTHQGEAGEGRSRRSGRILVSEGTFRTDSFRRTRASLQAIIAERGISRVAELTGLDVLGIPVFSAVRPSASTLAVSAGKGLDSDAGWISAVMESLEVRAAEQFRARSVERAPAASLPLGYSVLDLNLHPLSIVDDDTVLDWEGARDLTRESPALVPTQAIGLRGWTACRWAPPMFLTTSNGLAAGNDSAEAALHGLLELIERDAISRAAGAPRMSIAPATVNARLCEIANRLDKAGATISLQSIASLGSTWTFLAYLFQPEMPHVFVGSGCHLDAGIAAERAVLEAIQSRASVISGLRDDIPHWMYAASASPTATSPAGNVAELLCAVDSFRLCSIQHALALLVQQVTRSTGRPVLAVDLSPPTEPFPAVVQVFAPGLLPAPEVPRP